MFKKWASCNHFNINLKCFSGKCLVHIKFIFLLNECEIAHDNVSNHIIEWKTSFENKEMEQYDNVYRSFMF